MYFSLVEWFLVLPVEHTLKKTAETWKAAGEWAILCVSPLLHSQQRDRQVSSTVNAAASSWILSYSAWQVSYQV